MVLQRPEDLPDLVAEELVQGLERFVRTQSRVQQNALDGFSPGALEALRIRGELFGLPLSAAPVVLQYDAKLFDAAGVPRPETLPSGAWTWQAFLDAARRLTRDTNGDGRIDVYGVAGSVGPVEMWVWQAGGEVVSPDGRRSLLAERPAVDAIAFYGQLLNAGVRGQVPSGDRPVFAADGVHLGTTPEAPRVAMMFGSPSAVSFGPEWPLRVTEVPRGRRQATAMRLESAFALAMATTTPQPATVYSAMLALAVEAQRHLATPTRAPSVAQLRDSPAGTVWREEEMQAYVASLKYARALPLAQQRAIHDILSAYVTAPLSGGSVGTADLTAAGPVAVQSPEQAARNAAAAIDEILRR